MPIDIISYSKAKQALSNTSGSEAILSALAETKQSIESRIAQSEASHYQEKTATKNGDVYPDEGYNALSKVTVAVAFGVNAITRSTGYVVEPVEGTASSVITLPTISTVSTATGIIE